MTGNYLGSVLALIEGINLSLMFELGNGGLLPVYIPDITYNLAVNGVPVGQATSLISTTINPGQTERIVTVQNIKKDGIDPAIISIVESGGIIDVKASGTAYFELWGREIPVPFESSRQISIIDEVKKKLGQDARDARITLSVSESEARPGATVYISGRLTGGRRPTGLPGMDIHIKDDDTGSRDEYIATVRTDTFGGFSHWWTAEATDLFDDTVEIYAVFEGGGGFAQARSAQHDIVIADDAGTQRQQQDAFSPTSITLDIPHTQINEGDVLSISGRLTDERGNGIRDALIHIKDNDAARGDDVIAIVYTDANGKFGHRWTAEALDWLDDVVEIYAVFEGGGGFAQARSAQHDIVIADDAGTQRQQQDAFSPTSITLDIPHTQINEGDVLSISGRLTDERGNGIRDALIHIKDEDTGSGDDDIATVRTDADGDFYYRWTARTTDMFDNTVEIYAVFEGSLNFGSSRSVQIDVRVR